MNSQGALGKITDITKTDSLTSQLRQKRWEHFRELAAAVRRPMSILDMGGTQDIWQRIGFADQPDIHITLLNVYRMPADHANIESVIGDARSMPNFRDRQFDIVFSNSVIEHVGDEGDILRMANEIRRLGKNYYIQTPNRYFPIEPHFFFPMFQFLPVSVRTTLVQNFQLGWIPKIADRNEAEREVRSIRLLSKGEMKALFPDAHMLDEKFFGLTKSIQCYRFEIPVPTGQTAANSISV